MEKLFFLCFLSFNGRLLSRKKYDEKHKGNKKKNKNRKKILYMLYIKDNAKNARKTNISQEICIIKLTEGCREGILFFYFLRKNLFYI